MTEIKFRDTMEVTLIDHKGSDDRVIQAAKVSTLGADSWLLKDMDETAKYNFIRFLLKNRHGSPFEHSDFTFLIHAPIFVWREMMRHRIASYNEESGRYKKLEPVFYLPGPSRKMIQVGKPGHYTYELGTKDQTDLVVDAHMSTAQVAYDKYEVMLNAGIAREVARMSLPLNIYSSAYVTMNARALMNFLSLRVVDELNSYFPSYAMYEIEMVAKQMESIWRTLMPITAMVFHNTGRIAP